MIITYRNPLQLSDTIDVYFDIPSNDFNDRWIKELKSLLTKPYHLEKNYCFMGFVDTPRNVEYLCSLFIVSCLSLAPGLDISSPSDVLPMGKLSGYITESL